MNEIRNHIQGDFTMIPNGLINDVTLSDRSRFLYIVLAQKPRNWRFYTKELSKTLGMHVDTFRKYRDELSIKGWITVEKQQISNGKFKSRIYHLNGSPKKIMSLKDQKQKERIFPLQKNSATEKNGDGKNHTLSNTNKKQIRTDKNKNIKILKKTKNSTFQNPNPRQ